MKWEIACFSLFISVFYIAGFAILGYGVWGAWRSTRAAAWPTTPATLTRLEVEENTRSEDSTYEVQVEYTYAVEGVDYQGSRLAFGYCGSNDRPGHDEIHERLKSAKAVSARYDPANPAASCLSFGLHRSILFMLAFGMMWLAFPFGFTVLFWLFMLPDAVLLRNLAVE